MKFTFPKNIIILAVLIMFSAAGCSVWQNFTAYFNTYYNAKKLFEQVEEDRANQNHPLFEFKEPNLPSGSQTPIIKVIEKCSKILQFDKESAYVDDALFMIGKAFYYQSEFAKAQRKFNELDAVENTDLHLINQYWIGITDLQLRNFDKGYEKLEQVKQLALEEEEFEIRDMAYIKQIAFLNFREDYSPAVELSQSLIEVTNNDELKAETYFQLGKFYKELEDVENAAKAFAAVDDYSPSFEIEFLSKFESAKLQKELGNVDESLTLLQDMRDEGIYSQNFDKIDLEIAQIYLDREELEAAVELYTIIDTTYKSAPSSGEAGFKRAEIWEKYYRDYDSAKFYYDRAANSSATAERKAEARQKSQTLKQYFNLKESQENYYTQIYYRTDPEAFYKDSLDYEFFMRQDTSTANLDTLYDRENLPEDESLIKDTRIGQLDALDTLKIKDKMLKPVKMDISDDSLNTLVAKNLYELGNIFFGELGVSDSASYYYNLVDKNYPNVYFKPKFLFTLGNYYSSIGESEKADSLFNYVYVNFSADDIAAEAAKRLGKTEITESTDPVELSYIEAENIYFASNYKTAIDAFYNIYNEHPGSHLAPKALYTVGYIFENHLQLFDSAAVVYDTLASKYANTDYARASAGKLNFYRSYQRKIQDSLDLIQKQIADSIAADSVALIESEISVPDTLSSKNDLMPDSTSAAGSLPGDSAAVPKQDLPDLIEENDSLIRRDFRNLENEKTDSLQHKLR
jgi:tetratricopeptide (TPR) repeat protein